MEQKRERHFAECSFDPLVPLVKGHFLHNNLCVQCFVFDVSDQVHMWRIQLNGLASLHLTPSLPARRIPSLGLALDSSLDAHWTVEASLENLIAHSC